MSSVRQIRVGIEGVADIILHNGQLRDPMNAFSKALSAAASKAKKSKSDQDWTDAYETEFIGSLYLDPKLGPVIPADNLQAMLIEGARKRRLGMKFEPFVFVDEPLDATGYRLNYEGPRDPVAMFNTGEAGMRFIRRANASGSSVMRCRPKIKKGWSVEFTIAVSPGGPDLDQVKDAVKDAGLEKGLGDWLPRYGRFCISKFEQV